MAQVPATYQGPERAEFLVAQAEVSRLAGAAGQAEDGLRQALQFYQDRRMVVLASAPMPCSLASPGKPLRTKSRVLALASARRRAGAYLPSVRRGTRASRLSLTRSC